MNFIYTPMMFQKIITVLIGIGNWIHNHIIITFSLFKEGLKYHAPHHYLSLTVFGIALLESFIAGNHSSMRISTLLSFSVVIVILGMTLTAIALEIFRLWKSGYNGNAIVAIGLFIRDNLLSPQRLANMAHTFIFMSIFMTAFTRMKVLIPHLAPFSWDFTFMRADQILHFGRHPYELLQPFWSIPYLTTLLNFTYHSWFFVMFSAWVWQGFSKSHTKLRLHFLLSFMMTWFFGTCVFGLLFSSAGPCFYGRIESGADPFAPLMTYLHATAQVSPVWALNVQEGLWQYYVTGASWAAGISAMPSMHVATMVLLLRLGFAAGKPWLGWFFAAFTIVILIGSVHLAWHYAIDGYVGAAMALICWILAGRITQWNAVRTEKNI